MVNIDEERVKIKDHIMLAKVFSVLANELRVTFSGSLEWFHTLALHEILGVEEILKDRECSR